MTRVTRTLCAVVVAALVAPSAYAWELAPQGYAACTGVNVNPDQFSAGVQFQLGSNWKPQLRPSVEIGMGNGVRLVTLGGDVLYHLDGERWRPYAGGGPGLNFIDVTDGVGEAGGMSTKLVAHLVTGLSWIPGRKAPRRYFVEGRLGVGDTPNLRLTFGMSF